MKIQNSISFYGSKINTLYFNDLHGSTKHLNSFVIAQNRYFEENKNDTNITLCGGDMFLDTNTHNEPIAKILASRTDAIAAGNHDLEGGNYLASLIKKFNLYPKMLSANLSYTRPSPLKKLFLKAELLNKEGKKSALSEFRL